MSGAFALEDDPAGAATVLLIDPLEPDRRRTAAFLTLHGFRVLEAASMSQARERLAADPMDLVVAETGGHAPEVLSLFRLARGGRPPPLLIFTQLDDPVDRILALELGADDHLSKSCSLRELLARVRAVLRRTGERTDGRPMSQAAGGATWRLDVAARALVCPDGAVVHLTRGETALFDALLRSQGALVGRGDLETAAAVRRERGGRSPVDKMISRMRTKIEEVSTASFPIRNVWGEGYVLDEDARAKTAQGRGDMTPAPVPLKVVAGLSAAAR